MLTKQLMSVNKNSFELSILHVCLEADDKKISHSVPRTSQTICARLDAESYNLQLECPNY